MESGFVACISNCTLYPTVDRSVNLEIGGKGGGAQIQGGLVDVEIRGRGG